MNAQPTNVVRRAPWGRKKFLVSVPILSIVLAAAALASSSGLIHTNFQIFSENGLTLTAVVNNVVHASGPTGKVLGTLTIVNNHAFAIALTLATAVILSGTGGSAHFVWDHNVQLTVNFVTSAPLTIPAGTTVKTAFSGAFTGNVLLLLPSTDFQVSPNLVWFQVGSGVTPGPFTYSTAKVCSNALGWSSGLAMNGWDTTCA